MGSGTPLVDLVHVDDVVAAFLLAGELVRATAERRRTAVVLGVVGPPAVGA